jgi:hypothetical protein
MKTGDLIVDGDGRKGVVTILIETYCPSEKPSTNVGMVYFFESGKEEVMYEEDVFIVGG